MKAIKEKLGVTVNDVLMGVLGCAINRTLHKIDPDGKLGTPDDIKVCSGKYFASNVIRSTGNELIFLWIVMISSCSSIEC